MSSTKTSNTIMPPKTLDKLTKRLGLGKYALNPSTQNSGSSQIVVPEPFSIQSLDDRYVMSPVQYRGELHQVSLSKNLLGNGNTHTHRINGLISCKILNGTCRVVQ